MRIGKELLLESGLGKRGEQCANPKDLKELSGLFANDPA